MNIATLTRFRNQLRSNAPVYGLWVTLESPSITEMAVAAGLDWVVIDAEHGHLDWNDIVGHLRAVVRSDTLALIRVAEQSAALIKRALDIGADGIVVPWVESRKQLENIVRFANYPPHGIRGVGAERATCWGHAFAQHVAEANDQVLVIPILESVAAINNLDEMLEVPGIDVFFFGPADLSATAGYAGQWEGPGVSRMIDQAKQKIRSAGKHCGVVAANRENLIERCSQDFQMLGIGLDAGMLLSQIRGTLEFVGRGREIMTSLSPGKRVSPGVHPVGNDNRVALAPTVRPPVSMRPDRDEIMATVATGTHSEITPGVRFNCLVGASTSACNLTTGLVTFDSGAALPYHRHTFGESITLLQGQVEVEVEGRAYVLQPMDNVTIPTKLAHHVTNLDQQQEALLHISMATSQPSRTLVDKPFVREAMPPESQGTQGAERVVRFNHAKRYEAGPNTEFIDFCNRELMPTIEMSGGFGLFYPGGRLPAHYHEFDESICITEGAASCIVEGRRYLLSDCTTAFVPKGRVHYFINDFRKPMAMIWFYAGPMPVRIVVDEQCATVDGNPWGESSQPGETK
ncbi:MAG: aldolase/citrate lyase family protein [Pirellulales bacterium]